MYACNTLHVCIVRLRGASQGTFFVGGIRFLCAHNSCRLINALSAPKMTGILDELQLERKPKIYTGGIVEN